MRIYLAIKFHSDNRNRPLIEALVSRLVEQGHSVVCAVRDFENWGEMTFDPRELLMKSFAAIESCDLVLIEATEKGMGIGIEAGFAFARQKPVITIAPPDVDLSINLRSLSSNVVWYKDVSEVVIPSAFRPS